MVSLGKPIHKHVWNRLLNQSHRIRNYKKPSWQRPPSSLWDGSVSCNPVLLGKIKGPVPMLPAELALQMSSKSPFLQKERTVWEHKRDRNHLRTGSPAGTTLPAFFHMAQKAWDSDLQCVYVCLRMCMFWTVNFFICFWRHGFSV